jgi:hypothetical protein
VKQTVSLQWGTTNEVDNGYFTIEKSADGETFSRLTTVNSASTHAFENNYSYTDNKPYSLNYYRISQTDNNGNVSYFRTIQVNNIQTLTVNHFVSNNSVNVSVSGAVPGNGSITLYSIDGRKIATKNIELAKDQTLYTIEKPQQKGIYLISIESNGKRLYDEKLSVD